MNKKKSSENVFDEIDSDLKQVKTAMKLSRHERMLKKQIKLLKGLIVIVFIVSVISIYLGIFKGYKGVNISMAIMGIFLSIYSLVFLKIISKHKPKKEIKYD